MLSELLAMRGLCQRPFWFAQVAEMSRGDLGALFLVAALTVTTDNARICEIGTAFKLAIPDVPLNLNPQAYALSIIDHLIKKAN